MFHDNDNKIIFINNIINILGALNLRIWTNRIGGKPCNG